MDERAANFERALAAEKVFEYLVGLNLYAYVCPYADMPTFPSEVFASIVSYYDTSKKTSVWKDFEKALLRISNDKTYSWVSLYYLVEYLRYSQRVQPRDLTNIAFAVTKNITILKHAMIQSKAWVGRDYSNGLWGDIQRMIHNINEEFGLQLVV